ncbi:MAG: ubiquinone/menaquinone biosynthesis methyltransferase [Anaerolineales bacterium]|nr:ubiquinone/menaquinone biosynthesis methyltransferase [Anaerolineales bacterium]MBS3752042.1 ubiquinone/menaquinone biosynthesis methyltransferase [Anaerolineales bacterium]
MSPNEEARSDQQVQEMFSRIAPHYDLLNRLMTGWQDIRWRRFVIGKTNLPQDGYLLDLGTGTGDLAREALKQYPSAHPVAADFSLRMMRIGKENHLKPKGTWTAAHAGKLPFPENTFDAVVSGFLLRNLSDLMGSLREQYRVLKPEGRFVVLDTTKPSQNPFSPAVRFYLYTVIPALGKWVAGLEDDYTYLPESMDNFLRAEELLAYLAAVGYKKLEFKRFMLDTVAVHWGVK